MKNKNVKVVVLGDFGRSPRMQYHCLSLAENGHRVDVIGYGETDPIESVKLNPLIFYHYMLPVPSISIKLLNYILKAAIQAVNLLFLLFITDKADVLIVQNPPAVPSLIICWIYSVIVRAKFIIDWHNYAHTIMALSAGKSNPLVKVTKKIEIVMGKKADANFCVTKAMGEDLLSKWNIKAVTLYDRPPLIFRPISLREKHDFLLKFIDKYSDESLMNISSGNIFSHLCDDTVTLNPKRPGLLVSSTSWTEDEDFSILFAALQDYEDHHQGNNIFHLPELICVITGKGPLKNYYLEKIRELNWKFVKVITPWLEAEDYPLLLASADLGVSLHTSSSGLDLPMKVVDMFGCGLPVCAYQFKCLNELVCNEENSYTFNNHQELSAHILRWFKGFPNNEDQNAIAAKFREALRVFQNVRWRENWQMIASNYFE